MFDAFVVPEIAIDANGESVPMDLGENTGKMFQLTLAITNIVEQEALDVSLWGSADGAEWSAKPLLAFPQKFYKGVYRLLFDLSAHPEVRFLKAKWLVNRWGVGDLKPSFTFLLKMEEQAARAVAS